MNVRSFVPVTALAGLVLGLTVGPLPALAAARTHLTYAVLRDGDEIGQHQIDRIRDGDQETIAIKTDVVVKVALIPVYRFEHTGNEVWRGGHLTALSSKTNDDGTTHTLDVKAAADHIDVTGDGAKSKVDSNIIPASLWNPSLVHQTVLLNTITGKAMTVSVTDVGVEPVKARGQTVPAHHYRVSGDLERDVWFDAADTLLQVGFKAEDKSNILYVLR